MPSPPPCWRSSSSAPGVALYRYALDGEAVGGFSQDEMESAVKRKRGGGPAGAPTTV